MKLAILGAAAAMLSLATFSTPASAQYYNGYRDCNNGYSQDVTRCDRDGDRCATYRCDRDGDDCRRVSGFYARSHLTHRSRYYNDYDRDRYNRSDNGDTVRRCDENGYCRYYQR